MKMVPLTLIFFLCNNVKAPPCNETATWQNGYCPLDHTFLNLKKYRESCESYCQCDLSDNDKGAVPDSKCHCQRQCCQMTDRVKFKEMSQNYTKNEGKEMEDLRREIIALNKAKQNEGKEMEDLRQEIIELKKAMPRRGCKISLLVDNCAQCLSRDDCYLTHDQDIFKKILLSEKDAEKLLHAFSKPINNYKGDKEKFYAVFFSIIQDKDAFKIPCLSILHNSLLLTEVANALLAFFEKKEDPLMNNTVKEISSNEMESLKYLAGHIFFKLYKKLRTSPTWRNDTANVARLNFLRSAKVEDDSIQRLVSIRDRGGLWMVNDHVHKILYQCELFFRKHTLNFTTAINFSEIKNETLASQNVMQSFKCLVVESGVNENETCKNVLEDVITLFIRIRSFSFAKTTKENFKQSKNSSRAKSLRTEIKRASSSKQQGH